MMARPTTTSAAATTMEKNARTCPVRFPCSREKATSAVIVLGWVDDGKVGLMSLVTTDLVGKGLHAGNLVREAAKVVGGKGGGSPTGIAQAGGTDASKLGEALALARKVVGEKLGA